ncbi:MAG TPA: zinc ribbon domain-containing protein [Ktedonobacteraceae bacterium]|nr:zinc ribbon domain-containing protein [Ktedonobacteraceae bacterium]
MPQYEFLCSACGPFTYWRSFSEASVPLHCPVCGQSARRIYSAPGLVKTPPALAKAMHRAEKSACEPEIVTKSRPVEEEAPQPRRAYRSHGRPWQIGH